MAGKTKKDKNRLTKHIRLLIYNFLDVWTTFSQISLLSIMERTALKESYIAREGKMLCLQISERNWPYCMLHENRLGRHMRRIGYLLSIVEKIQLEFSFSHIKMCHHHDLSTEIANFIALLP
jgi:hypothetical protein